MSNNGNVGARPAVGDLLAGRYRLDGIVGRGGMASVYRATDEALGRTVAIKIFESELAHASDVRRQRDEITLLATLNHPSLVTLFDAVADDLEAGIDRAFLVLEFVDGPDLSTTLESGPLDSRTVALLGADVSEALDYIHSEGVVHRDVKPANILMPTAASGNRSTAKLADFGIARLIDGARLTETGSFLGTASYLSPEQARGETVGAPSDVYSLGLVLLESLTGERAFPGSALESTAARLSRDPDVPARLDAEWSELIRSMTSRLPADRPGPARTAVTLRTIAGQDDRPEPTLVLPAQAGATERLNVGSAATERMTIEPTAAERQPVARPKRRRVPPLAWVGLGAIILIPTMVFAISGIATMMQPQQDGATPAVAEYPAVEGELGDHLEQLQRTVEP